MGALHTVEPVDIEFAAPGKSSGDFTTTTSRRSPLGFRLSICFHFHLTPFPFISFFYNSHSDTTPIMLLANYASDSGSDSDSEPGSSRPPASATAKSTISSSGSHSKPLASVSTPVSNPGSKGKRKGPVKITLDLPKPSGGQARGQDESDANSDEGAGSEDGKAEMKVRPTASGLKGKGRYVNHFNTYYPLPDPLLPKRSSYMRRFSLVHHDLIRSSSLLGMLPPPKRKQTMGTTKSQPLRMNKSMAAKPKTPIPAPKGMPDLSGIHPDAGGDDDGDGVEAGDGGMLVPPFVSRGKIKNVSKDQVDLFGLCEFDFYLFN